MTDGALAYRWTRAEFVRAWEAGAFERRVELVNGEVWPVVIGPWHGETVARFVRALPDVGTITTATLPSGDSLPDPDFWVCRRGAEPVSTLGTRLVAWAPSDVLLVVEVADETVVQDLGTKATLYGQAGYPVYWVVTREAIYEHTEPMETGYRTRVEHRAGDRVPVAYADTALAVDDLISPP